MTLSTEDTPAAPVASAPPNDGSTDAPRSSEIETIQLELPELADPDDRPLDLALRIDAARTSQPRSSVQPQQRLAVADAAELPSELSHPFPVILPTTHTDGDVPVECPFPVHGAPAPPPSSPATTQQIWPTRGTIPRSPPPWETFTAGTTPWTAASTRQLARARTPTPPWQRSSSRTHWYGPSIARRLCIWHSVRRVGNFWTTIGHWVNIAGSWLLLNLERIGGGIWRALRCIGHGSWRAMRVICAVIGWMSECITALHEMTDHRIWSAMLLIALAMVGYLMFPLVMKVMPPIEPAPITAPSPTAVPVPTTGFRWARVVGTEGLGLLIRDVPNGKRRMGDGLSEGTIVVVISGPATTADAQNPIWWQVRHNGVTGWVSGRFLAFTDQER